MVCARGDEGALPYHKSATPRTTVLLADPSERCCVRGDGRDGSVYAGCDLLDIALPRQRAPGEQRLREASSRSAPGSRIMAACQAKGRVRPAVSDHLDDRFCL